MKVTPEYTELLEERFRRCSVRPERHDEVMAAVNRVQRNWSRYEVVSKDSGVPAWVIACLHCLEASFSFGKHLHNGDPLTARTKRVPAGRPKAGEPPFTWEESTLDALEHDGALSQKDWSLGGAFAWLEGFNGWGYQTGAGRESTPPKTSAYLWSFTTEYEKGKYASDGKFDRELESEQVGVAALVKGMLQRGLIEAIDDEDSVSPIPQAPSLRRYEPCRVPIAGWRPLLQKGDYGQDVFQLKCALIGLGVSIRDSILGGVSSEFDESTKEAVLRLQISQGLERDGVVGFQTRFKIEELLRKARTPAPKPPKDGRLRDRVVKLARERCSQGRRHAPGNVIDREVLDPLRPILVSLGHLGASQKDSFYDWCAANVTKIYRDCGVKVPDRPIVRGGLFWASVALVETWKAMAKECGAWKPVKDVKAGDAILYDWTGNGTTDHIGVCLGWKGDGNTLIVAEGNKGNQEVIIERNREIVAGCVDLEILAEYLSKLAQASIQASI